MSAPGSPGDGPDDGPWVDRAAGPVLRPYAITGGRTKPRHDFDLLSVLRASGRAVRGRLAPEHAQALALCTELALGEEEATVFATASRLGQPVTVTKIILSDLLDLGLVSAHPPRPAADPTDLEVLEVIARALRDY